MRRIGIISDTHGYLDENVYREFQDRDEIWHAGDFGDLSILEKLADFKPLTAVYGNIDGMDVRAHAPEQVVFACEEVKVLMRHIGGYPPRYNPATKKELSEHKPGLFIAGHSHILKIQFDPVIECLHINPGAAGKQGWHKVRTLVKLTIDGSDMRDCAVIEMGR
jgi:putative phosphoesterase